MQDSLAQRIPLQLSRGRVIASIQIDLTERVLVQFRRDLLEFVRAHGANGVVLDLHGVAVLDGEEFEALRRTLAMVRLLGAETVVAGLRPGVVAALVSLGVDTSAIHAAIDVDGAIDLLADLAKGAR